MQQDTEKTFREVLDFLQYANIFTAMNGNKKYKILYAIKRVLSRLEKTIKNYNNELEDNNIDFALTDSSGAILYDVSKNSRGEEVRHYRFSKDGLKGKRKKDDETEEKWNNKKIVVITYYMIDEEAIKMLTEQDIDAFKGFILPDFNAADNVKMNNSDNINGSGSNNVVEFNLNKKE